MQIRAAQGFRIDTLAGRRLHLLRTSNENSPRSLDDYSLVAHCRDVGASSGAGTHHRRNLLQAPRGHLGDVAKYSAELMLVGKYLLLQRQKGATRFDQIDRRQSIFPSQRLHAYLLSYSDWQVGTAFHCRIIRHNHARAPRNDADASDDASRRRAIVVEFMPAELTYLKEGRARIEQDSDALAYQELAARAMQVTRVLASPSDRLYARSRDTGAENFVFFAIAPKGRIVAAHARMNYGHYSAPGSHKSECPNPLPVCSMRR